MHTESTGTRIALVTGSSRGIGRGVALALTEAGFDVVVYHHEDPQNAEETAQRISALGRRTLRVEADVGAKRDVENMFDRALAELGPPDLLVNNAGVQTWKPFLELSEEDWDRTIRTNLKGTFLCSQIAARHMTAARRGKIINIGSGCNKAPFPNLIDYTSSKGGIEMFTRVASVELGCYGITVNCVAPGTIGTERTRAETADYAATWSPLIPLGRIGQVSDVAAAVLFLASPGGDFITGQTIYVDGGLFNQVPWPYPFKRSAD